VFADSNQEFILKTDKGCFFTWFDSPTEKKVNLEKNIKASWDGKCVNGYLDGLGYFLLRNLSTGNILSQYVTYKRGKENGTGTETWEFTNGNTSRFEGLFIDGRYANGVLTRTYPSQGNVVEVSTGSFKNGVLSGPGTVLQSKNGVPTQKFSANFIDGKINGYGEVTQLPENLKWAGNFTNDKRDGVGTLYRPDGSTDWLAFENDKIPNVGVGDGSREHYYCAARGLFPGTSQYAMCRNYVITKMDDRKRMEDYIKQSNQSMKEALDRVDEIDRRYRNK